MNWAVYSAPDSDKASGVPNVEKSRLSTGSLMGEKVYDCGLSLLWMNFSTASTA